MGLHYTARLVYGYPIRFEPRYVTTTKYREDTGAAYQTYAVEGELALIKETVVAETQDNNDEWLAYQDDLWTETFNLTLFSVGYDSTHYILGKSIGDVSESTGWIIETQLERPQDVIDFGKDCQFVPAFYLILSAG